MQGRLPRKMKRYLTEPDEFSNQNKSKYNNLTLKQLKIHVGGLEHLNEIKIPQVTDNPNNSFKLPNHFIPFHTKLQNKRNVLKKLPQLNNHSEQSNGQDQARVIQGPPLFKRSNPLFVVNTLFQILKDDQSIGYQKNYQKINKNTHCKTEIDKTINQSNEFSDFGAKSVKIHRVPRLVNSQMNRLTQQSNFSRRKIYSQGKSRAKATVNQVELLTFYKPKMKEEYLNNLGCDEMNQFLV